MDDILARLKPAANAPASDPLRFALYNLVLSDGQLDFADLPAGRTHVVRDLRPYLAYWPESLPFRLDSAVLHADIKLAFEQAPGTVVRLSGTATAEQVRLLETRAGRRELLAFDWLEVGLEDVRPLERKVKLSAVTLSAPALNMSRDWAGRLNLLPPGDKVAIKNGATDDHAEGLWAKKM